MIRKLVWTPFGAIVLALAIATAPVEAQDISIDEIRRLIRSLLGSSTADVIDVNELRRDDREEVLNALADFGDELEDVVGRRQSKLVVRAIRRGDNLGEVVGDLELSRERRRTFNRMLDDFRDDVEDIVD